MPKHFKKIAFGDNSKRFSVVGKVLYTFPHHEKNCINRIIDANINRLKEGLRVCEEITRFILNNNSLTSEFKQIRHKIDSLIKRLPAKSRLLRGRDSLGDIGKDIYINELKRKNYKDIFFANIQRAKESTRVLEEFSKLISKNIAIEFKNIRYSLYELERKTADKIQGFIR